MNFIHDFYYGRRADFAIIDGLQGLEYGPIVAQGDQTLEESQQNMRLIMVKHYEDVVYLLSMCCSTTSTGLD